MGLKGALRWLRRLGQRKELIGRRGLRRLIRAKRLKGLRWPRGPRGLITIDPRAALLRGLGAEGCTQIQRLGLMSGVRCQASGVRGQRCGSGLKDEGLWDSRELSVWGFRVKGEGFED